uniref:Transposase n=1 Tax=Strongyloides papillosus TaxID=174720 RepID=A0A0N5B4I5_STREA
MSQKISKWATRGTRVDDNFVISSKLTLIVNQRVFIPFNHYRKLFGQGSLTKDISFATEKACVNSNLKFLFPPFGFKTYYVVIKVDEKEK